MAAHAASQPAAAATDAEVGAAPSAPEGSSASASAQGAAWALLKEVTLKSFRGLAAPYVATREKRQALRDAIMLAYQDPWPAAGWVAPPPASTSPQQQASKSAQAAPHVAQQEQQQAAEGEEQGGGAPPASGAGGGPLVMIGLMASDVRMGARAMRDYCQALGLTYTKPESRVPGVSSAAAIQGSVYLKYNSQSKVCYVSPYQGKERGVLLQLGVEQLGHFPLGLWDEDMRNPPAPL